MPKNLLPNAWFGRTRTRQSRGAEDASDFNNDSSETEGSNEAAERDGNGESGGSGMNEIDKDEGSEFKVDYFDEETKKALRRKNKSKNKRSVKITRPTKMEN